ncbi:MAG: hypothetical protein M1497_15930 [Nitrospirae bacterium]|nr:hypothetical protein [Nitrospirota bacterium]
MWYPGIDTSIGVALFLAALVLFVVGLYKVMERVLGRGRGSRAAEAVLCGLSLLGLLKGCGIL